MDTPADMTLLGMISTVREATTDLHPTTTTATTTTFVQSLGEAMVATRNRDYGDVKDRPKNPCKPPADGSCLFLTLPAELRNRIYELVLTDKDGLYMRETNGRAKLCFKEPAIQTLKARKKTANKLDDEANQLQYVSRQLRAETRRYGLKLNDLYFVTYDRDEASPLGACVNFLMSLAPRWFQYLRNIIIRRHDAIPFAYAYLAEAGENPNGKYYDFDAQDELRGFCNAYPNMTIHWTCPKWELKQSFCTFLLIGMSLAQAYRGIDLRREYNLDDDDGDWLDRHSAWCRPNGAPDFSAVPNFKVYPRNVAESRAAFDECVRGTLSWCRHHVPMDANVNTLKELAASWYTNGI